MYFLPDQDYWIQSSHTVHTIIIVMHDNRVVSFYSAHFILKLWALLLLNTLKRLTLVTAVVGLVPAMVKAINMRANSNGSALPVSYEYLGPRMCYRIKMAIHLI